jgi:hypothetical protein
MCKKILRFGAVMLITFAFFSPIIGQTGEKRIRVIDKFSKKRVQSPVAVVNLRSEGKIIENQKPFLGSDNWLNQTQVTLKNISDRPISNVVLHVWFQNEKGLQTPIPVSFLPYSTKGTARGKLILPNEDVTINLGRSHQYYTSLRSKVPVLSVDMSVEFVFFDNDTAWSKGAIFIRDPEKPQTWINTKYLEEYKNDKLKKDNLNILPIKYITSSTSLERLLAKTSNSKQEYCFDLRSQEFSTDYCNLNTDPCTGQICDRPPLLFEYHIRVPVEVGFELRARNTNCFNRGGCYCCNDASQDCGRILSYLDESCDIYR